MATTRSSLRDGSRPTTIDAHEPFKPHRARGRRHDRKKHSTKRRASPQSAEPAIVRPQRLSDPIASEDTEPSLDIDFTRQPYERVSVGQSIRTDVLVRLRYPQHAPSVQRAHLDYSSLITFVTLIAEGRDGERIPLDASAILAQRTCDTLHSCQQPEKQSPSSWCHFPDRLALGSSSFTDLKITKPGTYRLRITLMRTGGIAGDGVTSLAYVDSVPIAVYPPMTRRR